MYVCIYEFILPYLRLSTRTITILHACELRTFDLYAIAFTCTLAFYLQNLTMVHCNMGVATILIICYITCLCYNILGTRRNDFRDH